MEATNTLTLSETLTQNANAVNTVHILGTMVLIYLVATAWYYSSDYIRKDDKSRNIEPYLRWVILFNLSLMCIVFPGLSMAKSRPIGDYYVDNGIKSWNEVTCNDYPSSYLYLFLIMIQIECLHHTINVVRIGYELQKSTHVLRNYFLIILVLHSLLYFIVGIVFECNPWIFLISIFMVDYTEHIILTRIYFVRICRCDQYLKRNVWGLIGVMAHMICIIPMLYKRSVLTFVFMYLMGFVNFLGWYKLAVNTPKEFLVNEPIKSDDDDDEDEEVARTSHV